MSARRLAGFGCPLAELPRYSRTRENARIVPVEWGVGAREELVAIVQRAQEGLPDLPAERGEQLRELIEARLHARERRWIGVRDVEDSARIVVPAWRASVRAGPRGRSPLVACTWAFVVALPILLVVLEATLHPCRELLRLDLTFHVSAGSGEGA